MTTGRSELGEALERSALDALARADRTGVPQCLALCWSVPQTDALALFDAITAHDAFYWEQPEAGVAIAAAGCVETVAGAGQGRFYEAARRSRALLGRIDVRHVGRSEARWGSAAGPRLVGGFGFYEDEPEPESPWRDFGAGRLVLPEWLYFERDGIGHAVLCAMVSPNEERERLRARLRAQLERAVAWLAGEREPRSSAASTVAARVARRDDDAGDAGPEYRVRADRSHARYCAQVSEALDDIDAGKLSKVVIARSLRVRHDEAFEIARFLDDLRRLYPSCTVLAVRRGERSFVSATPERLVALEGERVSTAAVAGSAPRGRSPEEEARHVRTLLGAEKERNEHELVKRAIAAALHEVCGELEGPDEPRLLQLEGIQHLETPLSGTLRPVFRESVGLLELVARLHPTPAVAGTPSAVALDWLRRHEALDRGWYAGPIGHLDAEAGGEFRVALRSGLIEAGQARLFAGAGIVNGSRPDQELAETRLKLRALLAPLTEI